jgi:hypothetical protein
VIEKVRLGERDLVGKRQHTTLGGAQDRGPERRLEGRAHRIQAVGVVEQPPSGTRVDRTDAEAGPLPQGATNCLEAGPVAWRFSRLAPGAGAAGGQ